MREVNIRIQIMVPLSLVRALDERRFKEAEEDGVTVRSRTDVLRQLMADYSGLEEFQKVVMGRPPVSSLCT